MRVLLADSDAERAGLVEALLARGGAVAVSRLAPGEVLLDAVARIEPDVVIVDMARPDRDALDDIRTVTLHAPRPIVMFVDQDDRHFMEEAIAAGVSSYNVVGVDLPQDQADHPGGGGAVPALPTGRGGVAQGRDVAA